MVPALHKAWDSGGLKGMFKGARVGLKAKAPELKVSQKAFVPFVRPQKPQGPKGRGEVLSPKAFKEQEKSLRP